MTITRATLATMDTIAIGHASSTFSYPTVEAAIAASSYWYPCVYHVYAIASGEMVGTLRVGDGPAVYTAL